MTESTLSQANFPRQKGSDREENHRTKASLCAGGIKLKPHVHHQSEWSNNCQVSLLKCFIFKSMPIDFIIGNIFTVDSTYVSENL